MATDWEIIIFLITSLHVYVNLKKGYFDKVMLCRTHSYCDSIYANNYSSRHPQMGAYLMSVKVFFIKISNRYG